MSCPPPGVLLYGEHPHRVHDVSGVTDLECPLPLADIFAPKDRPRFDAKCQHNAGDLIRLTLTRAVET
jgi:hypothetical protein